MLADLNAGQVLFQRAADKRFLPASMTKVMTALVVFDLLKAGRLREDQIVTVRPEVAAKWAGKGTTLNLRGGEQVTVRDLLRGTTTVSANDAAFALAEAAAGSVEGFAALMNARARAVGMTGSNFANPSGLPDGGKTYVTANDLIRLATALINDHPALYREYFGKKFMIWRGGQYNSHDPFAGVLPGADGIKTGFTRESGYNFLGAAERDGRRLVLVIGGAPSEPARADAAKALAEWGYNEWRSLPFLAPDTVVGEVMVQNGDARSVPVAVTRAWSLALPRPDGALGGSWIVYQGPVKAPIAKGQVIGHLVIGLIGTVKHSVPIVATRDVGVAGPFDRIGNALLGLVE